MTTEATFLKDGHSQDIIPAVAVSSGEVRQLANGLAGFFAAGTGGAIGAVTPLQTKGLVRLLKTASIAILDGGDVYWDASTNYAHFAPAASRFYVGRAVGDSAESATTVDVALNVFPRSFADLSQLGCMFDNVLVGGATYVAEVAGSARLTLAATNEAEKSDLLGALGIPVTRPCIMECRVAMTAAAGSTDINIGLANGTHASDFESVTEAAVFHMDGASLAINAQSRDGTTTVAVADTTKAFVAATPIELWVDARDLTNVKLYVNGVRVLSASTFKLDKATGPLKPVVHVEKSSSTDTAIIRVEKLRVRTLD